MDQKDLLETGMESWNELCVLLSDDDMTFSHIDEFSVFYRNLCARLFEVEGETK